MAGNFSIEHVRTTPRGWKVRTAMSGRHRVRIAFPPGARRKGSGEVVEILHPKGENPSCNVTPSAAAKIASKFPAELPHGSAGRTAKSNSRQAKTYRVIEIDAGDKTRELSSGLSRKEALEKLKRLRETYGHHGLRFVMYHDRENPRRSNASELLIFGNPPKLPFTKAEKKELRRLGFRPSDFLRSDPEKVRATLRRIEEIREKERRGEYGNPKGGAYVIKFGPGSYSRTFRTKFAAESFNRKTRQPGEVIYVRPGHDFRNPKGGRRRRMNQGDTGAAELYQEFHGREPREILEMQEALAQGTDYAALGALVQLVFKDGSGKRLEISFEGDRVKVAANPEGTQIYFFGGNQNVGGSLEEASADASKDFVELGECLEIVYTAQKGFDGFQTIDYVHKFGEDGGAKPTLVYAKQMKKLLLIGGDYRVEAPGIVN
jgi:hypothetical protein